MRRVFVLPVLAIALFAAAGVAVAGDVNGPRCADITDGSFFYNGTTGTFSVEVFVAAASCKGITYTLFVIDEESGGIYTDSAQGDGDAFYEDDGTDFVALSTSVTSDVNGGVCFYVTTTNTGGRVLDRAPDTGCRSVAKNQSGSGSGFS
jgi:hypothetical protein